MPKLRVDSAATRQYVTVLSIQCDTSRFVPGDRNGFKCTICRDFFPFPSQTSEVVIIALSVGRTTVLDAATGATLHNCGEDTASERPLVSDLGEILRKAGKIDLF